MKAYNLIIVILIIFLNIEGTFHEKCGADKLKIKSKQLDLKPENKKNLARPASYTPIKIGFDFTTFVKPSEMSSSTFSKIKAILKETRKEFSKILQVIHENFNLTNYKDTIMTNCGLNTIGKNFANFLVTNDLIIFPIFTNLEGGEFASASHCLTSGIRPIAGVLYINASFDSERTNMELYLKNILFHEIIHILGFNPETLTEKNMLQTISSVTYVNSPNVLNKAKSYFGYSAINGVPLEDQNGTIGYHWESRYMLGDIMISTDFPEVSISGMTLALLEDTGFYKVNYYSGGMFKFGKNKGQDFFEKNYIQNNKATFEEFFDIKDEDKCSSSRTFKSSCFINSPKNYYQNHCQYGESELPSYYGEKIGANSLCFMSSLIPISSGEEEKKQIPICYESQCSSDSLILKIGSESFTCPSDGGSFTPSGFKGSITCPKYSDICSSNIICNEMFSCFTQLANKDNYNYDVTYCDYEGATYEYDDGGDDDYDPWWFEPRDGDDKPSRPRRKDSGLIGWKIALIIASLVLVKIKNNYAN